MKLRNAVRYTFNIGGHRTQVRAAKKARSQRIRDANVKVKECEEARNAHIRDKYSGDLLGERNMMMSRGDEELKRINSELQTARKELEGAKKK